MTRHAVAAVVASLVAMTGSVAVFAQTRAPRAELAATVETATIRAGRPATIVLKVTLPPTIHVQSDKPRDAAFFPTALVLTPPAGVTIAAMKYPVAVDFRQEGQPEPLAVFEKTFTVTATLALAASVKPGELILPGRFEYQACDDKVCYRPVKTDVKWALTVAP
jgi:DsbC/DsbD-like thiol-disulfide interchange protein